MSPRRAGRGEEHDRTHLEGSHESRGRGSASDEPERAVFYPEDERFLIERGERVDHFEVVFEQGWMAERT